VLVALDGSMLAESVLPEACRLADRGGPSAPAARDPAAGEVLSVTVVPPTAHDGSVAQLPLAARREQANAYLQHVARTPVLLFRPPMSPTFDAAPHPQTPRLVRRCWREFGVFPDAASRLPDPSRWWLMS
jgi:hypothetical protein